MSICLNSPLPTLDGIMASFKPMMTFPPKIPGLPKVFPSLPSPLFPSLKVPNFELMLAAIELQAWQLQTTMLGMIKPILSKLGISLSAFLPKIPGLPGMNLLDLLSGNTDAIISAVRGAIKAGFTLPGLPVPLYATIKIPDFEVIQTLQIIVANYMAMVAKLIPGLIKQVTDKFKWPGLPTIPSLPSMSQIMAMAGSKLPSLPSLPHMPAIPSLDAVSGRLKGMIMDEVGNFDVMAFMSKVTFPGLPALPVIPLPMVFSFKMPDIEFTVALNALYTHLTTVFLKPVMTFIENTLSKYLSFSFPKLCVSVG